MSHFYSQSRSAFYSPYPLRILSPYLFLILFTICSAFYPHICSTFYPHTRFPFYPHFRSTFYPNICSVPSTCSASVFAFNPTNLPGACRLGMITFGRRDFIWFLGSLLPNGLGSLSYVGKTTAYFIWLFIVRINLAGPFEILPWIANKRSGLYKYMFSNILSVYPHNREPPFVRLLVVFLRQAWSMGLTPTPVG